MTLHDKVIPVLRAYVKFWVMTYRSEKGLCISRLEWIRRKSTDLRQFRLSCHQCYATVHKNRFRILWVKNSGDPKSLNNRKLTHRVNKNFSVHRSVFRSEPKELQEIANICEDQFAIVRQLNYLLNEISKDVGHFNELAEKAKRSSGRLNKSPAIPVELFIRVNNKEDERQKR